MSLYLDRELQPAPATDLMKHVYTCTACQQYLETTEHVAMLLAEPPLAVPPADFVTKVMRCIHDENSMADKRPVRSPERAVMRDIGVSQAGSVVAMTTAGVATV